MAKREDWIDRLFSLEKHENLKLALFFPIILLTYLGYQVYRAYKWTKWKIIKDYRRWKRNNERI